MSISMSIPFASFAVDMDLCVVGLEQACADFPLQHPTLGKADTLFVSPYDDITACKVLVLYWETIHMTLNLWVMSGWPPGWWAVGKLGPIFGKGSTGP